MVTIEEHIRGAHVLFEAAGMRVVTYYPVGLGVSVSIQNSKGHCCQEGEVEIHIEDHPFLKGRLYEYYDGCGVAAGVPIEVAQEAMKGYSVSLSGEVQ